MNGFETAQERRNRYDHAIAVRKSNEEKVHKLAATGMLNADIAKEVGLCEAIVRTYLKKPRYYKPDTTE